MQTQPTIDIRFNADSKDYAIYVDGEFVGCEVRHHDAQVKANSIVFDRLQFDAERNAMARLSWLQSQFFAAKSAGDHASMRTFKDEGRAILEVHPYIQIGGR